MTFPEINLTKRSDDSFRKKTQIEHHKRNSAFLELPIDMVYQFPLDYLQTVCLGVVKKLLRYVVHREPKAVKLRADDKMKISNRLTIISKTQPMEFERKCYSLDELHNFKGSEFRSPILYILPVSLKEIVASGVYSNIITLHLALIILVNPTMSKSPSAVAQTLLEHFVKSFGSIYCSDKLVYVTSYC